MTLRVALDALRHDADTWERVSHVTKLAADEASGLGLTAHEVSEMVARTPFLATYQEIQEKTARLLAQAGEKTLDLCVTLHRVADLYERNDEDAAEQLKGVWDVHE
ncbi:hypothetical protein GCM10010168_46140 [Actinoplanes ianthinogenes]|uniref:Excreted virulence factor EspC (Type VII ESX diderm) n=1 Tax=Actinoplanes ianthinogenes TaxID=122358 RepID=A0ABM7LP91_9ACTN|nr:hypothetical protein [Actinoplanes ianthinogenes]BCJ41088.1 hypothetical protein Aiant_17450 [Actinoplanes ianthinogenes]GGR22979.1 hypothetical protein GCM10010168_46140 [Actinoplanes ianthinogenes]